jgi:hypothetical protein
MLVIVKGNSKVYVLRVLAMGVLSCSPTDKWSWLLLWTCSVLQWS